MVNMKLVKKGPGVSIKSICVKRGRLMVVLDHSISSLIHADNVHLRRNVTVLSLWCVIPRVFAVGAFLSSFSRKKSTTWWLIIILRTLI